MTTNAKDARDRYLEDGACLIEAVLDTASIETLKDVIADLNGQAPQAASSVQPFLAKDGTQVVKYDGGLYVEYLSRNVSKLRDFLRNSRIPQIVCDILDADKATFWRDEVHLKSGGSSTNATPWHHGIGSFPFKGEDVLTLWMPLTPVSIEDGPLRTIRGSHRVLDRRYRPPTRAAQSGVGSHLYCDVPDFDRLSQEDQVEVVTWTMAPGDALAFHPYTVHSSLPNIGPRDRIAYNSRWLGRDARYEPDVYSVAEPELGEEVIVEGLPDNASFPTFMRM